MSEWQIKRFWTDVSVDTAADGFEVRLDNRPVRTPAKMPMILPTYPMAEAVAEEWQMQEGAINPLEMPVTRGANAAIDRVMPQQGEVAELIAAYGDSDLLCYRADAPAELAARQCEKWDPALDWAADRLAVRLETRVGVIHKPQPAEVTESLARRVHALGPFHLTAFHDLVSLTGSLILGFAAAADWRAAEDIWTLSRLDEDWQAEQWGADEEAMAHAAYKRREFENAKRFFDLSGPVEFGEIWPALHENPPETLQKP